MTENTATVADDLQRVAAAASKPEKVKLELSLATLRDGQLELPLASLRDGQLELTTLPD